MLIIGLAALVVVLVYLWWRQWKIRSSVKFIQLEDVDDGASETVKEDIEGMWRCKSETYHITSAGDQIYKVEGKGDNVGDSFLATATINKHGQFSLNNGKDTALPQGTVFGRRRLVWSNGDTWYKCETGDTSEVGESSE